CRAKRIRIEPLAAADLSPGREPARPGVFRPYDDEPRRRRQISRESSPLRGSVLNDTLTTAFRGCCRNAEVRNFPLLFEEGWTRLQQNIAKRPYGADGVVIQFHRIFLRLNTTPSARAADASRLFLDRAATPPRRGGENSPLQPFGQQPLSAVA